MAVPSNVPVFTQGIRSVQTQVTAANTNRDGTTGAYSSSLAVGALGSLINGIVFQAIVTTAVGLLRIFYAPDGTNFRLIAEVPTTGATISGTVAGENHVWVPPYKFLTPTSALFKFNVNNAETWNIVLNGEDY